MSLYINNEKKIIFIHIVKNGGIFTSGKLINFYNFTRYEGMLPLSLNPYEFIRKYNELEQNIIVNTMIKIIKNGYLSLINSDYLNYKYFCVIRCPYQRFISGILFCNNKNECVINDLKNYILNRENLKNKHFTGYIDYSHIFVTQSQYLKNIPNLTLLNFENINKELCDFLKNNNFEIKHNEEKSYKNSSFKEKNFWEYYDKFIFDFVNEYFDEDFKNFNFPKYNSLIDFYYQMNKKYNFFDY